MSHITFIDFLFSKFLQKATSASKKCYLPRIIWKWLGKFHYNYMEYLLKPYFNKASCYLSNESNYRGNKNSSVIWMFWWQGLEKMPLLVKKCIQSIEYYSNGHKIILVDKNNVRDFAQLPVIIYKKVQNGQLDFTHFSDILRFNLLDHYGGLWIDSTIYCTSSITNQYFSYLYTTGGYHETPPGFVRGRWAEFLIGGNSKNNALKFMDKFLQLYFSNNNKLPSYFIADYGLDYAYNHNLGNFKYYVDNMAKGANPNLFKLVDLLNKSYDVNLFKLITVNTNMFKLTYKRNFNDKGNTFYNKLVNNELDDMDESK